MRICMMQDIRVSIHGSHLARPRERSSNLGQRGANCAALGRRAHLCAAECPSAWAHRMVCEQDLVLLCRSSSPRPAAGVLEGSARASVLRGPVARPRERSSNLGQRGASGALPPRPPGYEDGDRGFVTARPARAARWCEIRNPLASKGQGFGPKAKGNPPKPPDPRKTIAFIAPCCIQREYIRARVIRKSAPGE